MSKPHPRSFTAVREIEFQLKPFMATEAAEILARVFSRLIANNPRQFTQLTDQFKHTFGQEHDYLTSRLREDVS
jgi:hypothetical protein